jgi:5-(carboxyamino)imidazole ribonucleotide synthase
VIVGILGGGQLARMLALAGHPLGVRCVALDPSADACAFAVAEPIRAAYDDCAALERLAQRAQVVTYEFENVPAQSAEYLASHLPVSPASRALAAKQDRLLEKQLFEELGIPTAPWVPVGDLQELQAARERLGLPLVLKSRAFGYDGKGQQVLRAGDDLEAVWQRQGAASIAERFIAFRREVSCVAVRSRNDTTSYYPLAENEHRGGILWASRCRSADPSTEAARGHARRLLEHFDYVGVLALELFETEQGELLANEFAPRVHNSGHWTIEGAVTSQFENHLRAITDLPLGDTSARCEALMVNLIGELPELPPLLRLPDVHLHLYDKAPRPGRKLGHVTVLASDAAALEPRAAEVLRLLREP